MDFLHLLIPLFGSSDDRSGLIAKHPAGDRERLLISFCVIRVSANSFCKVNLKYLALPVCYNAI